MNLNSHLYLIFILAALGGGLLLVTTGLTLVGEADFTERRLRQFQKIQVTGEIPQPEEQIGPVVLSDYFEKNDGMYMYLGGLYGVEQMPGTSYSVAEIEEILQERSFAEGSNILFSHSLGKNNLYINLDRGVQDPAKIFLQTLDQYQKQGFDTLFVDFRFLREVDFSQMIAIFNQLSPREKINLGSVMNPYQRTELKTSGQPFFHADQYVFLMHSFVPESVRSLIRIFQSRPGYDLRGEMGEVKDTICVETEYDLRGEKYRICTDRYVPPEQRKKRKTLPDEKLQEMYLHMSEYWYGRQDTQYMMEHLPRWLSD